MPLQDTSDPTLEQVLSQLESYAVKTYVFPEGISVDTFLRMMPADDEARQVIAHYKEMNPAPFVRKSQRARLLSSIPPEIIASEGISILEDPVVKMNDLQAIAERLGKDDAFVAKYEGLFNEAQEKIREIIQNPSSFLRHGLAPDVIDPWFIAFLAKEDLYRAVLSVSASVADAYFKEMVDEKGNPLDGPIYVPGKFKPKPVTRVSFATLAEQDESWKRKFFSQEFIRKSHIVQAVDAYFAEYFKDIPVERAIAARDEAIEMLRANVMEGRPFYSTIVVPERTKGGLALLTEEERLALEEEKHKSIPRINDVPTKDGFLDSLRDDLLGGTPLYQAFHKYSSNVLTSLEHQGIRVTKLYKDLHDLNEQKALTNDAIIDLIERERKREKKPLPKDKKTEELQIFYHGLVSGVIDAAKGKGEAKTNIETFIDNYYESNKREDERERNNVKSLFTSMYATDKFIKSELEDALAAITDYDPTGIHLSGSGIYRKDNKALKKSGVKSLLAHAFAFLIMGYTAVQTLTPEVPQEPKKFRVRLTRSIPIVTTEYVREEKIGGDESTGSANGNVQRPTQYQHTTLSNTRNQDYEPDFRPGASFPNPSYEAAQLPRRENISVGDIGILPTERGHTAASGASAVIQGATFGDPYSGRANVAAMGRRQGIEQEAGSIGVLEDRGVGNGRSGTRHGPAGRGRGNINPGIVTTFADFPNYSQPRYNDETDSGGRIR